MGYTRIETVITNGEKTWIEIATDGLYEIVCPSGKSIIMLDKISDICFCEELLVLRTEDRDSRNGSKYASFIKDNREVNNIDVFDRDGNHLWNIGEVVGDIKMAFDGITHMTALEVEREYGVSCASDPCLFKCIAGGITYIIDGRNKKCLCRVMGKAK